MDFARLTADLLSQGQPACLVTAIHSADPEIPPGAKALFRRDGTWEGDAALAHRTAEAAREALSRSKRHTAEVAPGLRVFFDVLAPEARLVVCGAGHIAVPLARFAREVGFSVTVLDDRPDFASPARFPGCQVISDDFAAALGRLPFGPSTYAVVITRGHEHDLDCLAEILPKETAYVGLIGSRRRVGFVKIALAEQGIPGNRVARLFTPIGLPIGAESPAEIALSIAAELVAVRRRGEAGARTARGEQEVTP